MTASTSSDSNPAAVRDGAPWWRQTYCWLVIAGPLAVVIAGIATTVIAYGGADTLSPVYVSEHLRKHEDSRVANSMLPAETVSKGALLQSRATK